MASTITNKKDLEINDKMKELHKVIFGQDINIAYGARFGIEMIDCGRKEVTITYTCMDVIK